MTLWVRLVSSTVSVAVAATLVGVPGDAAAAVVVGASTSSNATNTCTVTAVKPTVASGVVSASFTVRCTVVTTVFYRLELREADGAGVQRLIVNTQSLHIAKAGTSYTVRTASGLACSSSTALAAGANTESSKEELFTFTEVSFGSYPARSEQTAIPAENSAASIGC